MTCRPSGGRTSPACSGRGFWRALPPPDSPVRAEAYLHRAGGVALTRTHGRREVAFLNRAWEDVLALDLCLDPASQAQPLLDHAVNTRPSRCAGFDGLGTGLARLAGTLTKGV